MKKTIVTLAAALALPLLGAAAMNLLAEGEDAGAGVTTTSHDYDWTSANNVAKGTTAYASYNQEQAGASIDGNNGSRWEPNAGQDPENVWYYVDLGYEYDIKAVGLIWNNAYASDYTLYTATEKVGEEPAWVELVNIKEMLGSNDEIETKDEDGNVTGTRTEWVNRAEGVTSTYVLPQTTKARYVKIQVNKNEVWGASFYEFMVDAEEVESTPIVTSVSLRTNTQKVLAGDAVNFTAEVRDQLNRIMDNADVTLNTDGAAAHVEGMTVIPDAKGTVSVTATCGAITSEAVSFEVVGDNAEYISGTGISCDENSNNAANAYDNNNGTEWTVTGEGEGEHEHWFMVELSGLYDLNLVTLNWEGANANIIEIQAGETAETLAKIGEVNVDPVVAGRMDYVAVDAKNVKYLKVITKNNATGYGLRLFDCRAYGTPSAYEQTATSIELAADKTGMWIGETATVTATVKDQQGAPMADATATLAVDGPATLSGNTLTATGKGTITVKAEYNGLNAEIALSAADKSQEITPASASSDAKNADGNDCAANAIDNNYTGSGWAAARDGYATDGATEYNLYVNLGKPCNIDAITLNWEGANAHQYQILGSKTEDGDYTPFYTHHEETNSVQGREDVFMGSEMNEIQYIQVKATAWGPYGINLFGIRFYGASAVTPVATELTVSSSNGTALYLNETAELSATVIDQFGDVMNGAEVSYSVNGSAVSLDGTTVTAVKAGSAVVTATCGSVSKDITFVVYESSETLDANRLQDTNVKVYDAEGNETTLGFGSNNLKPGYSAVVDLGGAKSIAMIELNWERAHSAHYVVSVSADGNEYTEVFTDKPADRGGNYTERIALKPLGASPASRAAADNIKYVKVQSHANVTDWDAGLLGVNVYTVKPITVSVKDISVNGEDGVSEYFDLQGRKVVNPAGGLYIKVQKGKASKVMIR